MAGVPALPTSELVAVAWIGSIPGFTADMVATQLPPAANKDGTPADWVRTGFVRVSVVGGSPHPSLPVKQPVMQVDCYATVPGSNKPPWGHANALAEAIRYATLDRTAIPRLLAISANGVVYPPARVLSAYVATEPRRIYDDPGDLAQYQMDVAVTWVTAVDRLD